MQKKKILVCAPYVTLPGEPGANRFVALSKVLAEKYDVTLVTSRFCHIEKKLRMGSTSLDSVQLVLIDEPGYKKNIGVARLYSHHVFCRNLRGFLKDQRDYDLIYSAFPLIESNLILGVEKVKREVPLIIDVQDVWPEAIAGAFPVMRGLIGRILMKPFTEKADKAYRLADALVAVSHTYLDRANIRKLPRSSTAVAYIGSDKLWFSSKKAEPSVSKTKLKAIYLGTLGGSYDVETLVRAAAMTPSVSIEIIGTGPLDERLRRLNQKLGNHASFTGALPYDEAMKRASRADIAINPIRSSAQQSVTNKLSDYFCLGLPILSSQENEEVRELLARGGGADYCAGDPYSLSETLTAMSENRHSLHQMSNCNKAIAQKLFLRGVTYRRISTLIGNVLNQYSSEEERCDT